MNFSPKLRDQAYYIAFFLVDLFASLEVTAVLVATPEIAKHLHIAENSTGWIINGYLFPVFIVMSGLLVFHKAITKRGKSKKFLAEGLLYFFIGNIICFFAPNPMLFFFGRLIQGIGAAMAFIGQLWSASDHYKDRIAAPLFWGEIGSALGIVLGPLVGGYFTEAAIEGWRNIFVFNALLSVLAFLLIAFLFQPPKIIRQEEPVRAPKLSFDFYIIITLEGVIALLTVGAEYFISNYFQTTLGKSAVFVGWITVIASLGIITGSYYMYWKNKNFANWSFQGVFGIIISLLILGLLIEKGMLLAGILPIFFIGAFMGIAGLSIYSYITRTVSRHNFFKSSASYLVAMQVGNSLGVQVEELGQLLNFQTLEIITLLILPALILLAIFFKSKRINFEI